MLGTTLALMLIMLPPLSRKQRVVSAVFWVCVFFSDPKVTKFISYSSHPLRLNLLANNSVMYVL